MRAAALLFGLNYANTDLELRGCIRDIEQMSEWLTKHMGFEDITVVTDRDPTQCTHDAMIARLERMMQKTHDESLDFVWIHYSGHGTNVSDARVLPWKPSDEVDGRDEAWVPSDADQAGLITDDTLASILQKGRPRTRIMVVSDACHSGTMCDLAFEWSNPDVRIATRNPYGMQHGNIVLLSGCLDSQVSEETVSKADPSWYGGVLTTELLSILRSQPDDTFPLFRLLQQLHAKLRLNGFQQRPQLSASVDLSTYDALFPDRPHFYTIEPVSDPVPPVQAGCKCGCIVM